MYRSYLTAKLHGVTVTAANLDYRGSVSIGADLLVDARIEPYEQVHVVNLYTGARWETYVIPGDDGTFELNGGGARCGVTGDRCVVMTYGLSDVFPEARVLELDEHNRIIGRKIYRTVYGESATEPPSSIIIHEL